MNNATTVALQASNPCKVLATLLANARGRSSARWCSYMWPVAALMFKPQAGRQRRPRCRETVDQLRSARASLEAHLTTDSKQHCRQSTCTCLGGEMSFVKRAAALITRPGLVGRAIVVATCPRPIAVHATDATQNSGNGASEAGVRAPAPSGPMGGELSLFQMLAPQSAKTAQF